MKKQNIAIFGSGYVGNYLLDGITDHSVKIYNKQDHAYDHAPTLLDILKQDNPDYVINACGYTGRPNVDACETDREKCWDLNVNLPVTISAMCETLDIPFIHVSSGCIYTGYDKEYTETDTPNFGLDSDDSSWYSKTKHAGEIALNNQNNYILRVRMPFCGDNHERNFFNKILKYDNLISYDNSMTCIEDFVIFIQKFIENLEIRTGKFKAQPGIFNVCNPGSADLKKITAIFEKNGIANPDWSFVPIENLDLAANRSNCVLNCTKIEQLGLGLPHIDDSLEDRIAYMCKKFLFKTGLTNPRLGVQVK